MGQVIASRVEKKIGYYFKTSVISGQVLYVRQLCQDWDTNSGHDDGPPYEELRKATKEEAMEFLTETMRHKGNNPIDEYKTNDTRKVELVFKTHSQFDRMSVVYTVSFRTLIEIMCQIRQQISHGDFLELVLESSAEGEVVNVTGT